MSLEGCNKKVIYFLLEQPGASTFVEHYNGTFMRDYTGR
jgi:hypothetical protein